MQRRTRPLIGITTYGRSEDNRFRLPSEYVDSVRRAGGLAVLVPPGEESIDELLRELDGLVLAGGGDLDPRHYGGAHHETIYNLDPERDASELALARKVFDTRLPTLGICRGLQTLNVALGGTLHPHIPDVFGESTVHRLPPREPTEHEIRLQLKSRLGDVLAHPTGEFVAASWHHQAIRDVAPGFNVVAHAPDGVIEAVEHSEHPWLIAVQWHPELTSVKDPVQQRLFDVFVEQARKLGRTRAR